MLEDLTVVCGVQGKRWKRWGETAMCYVHAFSPNVKTWLLVCPTGERIVRTLRASDTEWTMFTDADVLATGDVRKAFEWDGTSPVVGRMSNMHESGHAWSPMRWTELLEQNKLRLRCVLWSGVFWVHRSVKEPLCEAFEKYRPIYARHSPKPLRRHPKPDQHTLSMALSSIGILDEQTQWVGPESISWHSHPGECGVIHHFNGQIYKDLESRPGGVVGALRERINATESV